MQATIVQMQVISLQLFPMYVLEKSEKNFKQENNTITFIYRSALEVGKRKWRWGDTLGNYSGAGKIKDAWGDPDTTRCLTGFKKGNRNNSL